MVHWEQGLAVWDGRISRYFVNQRKPYVQLSGRALLRMSELGGRRYGFQYPISGNLQLPRQLLRIRTAV